MKIYFEKVWQHLRRRESRTSRTPEEIAAPFMRGVNEGKEFRIYIKSLVLHWCGL